MRSTFVNAVAVGLLALCVASSCAGTAEGARTGKPESVAVAPEGKERDTATAPSPQAVPSAEAAPKAAEPAPKVPAPAAVPSPVPAPSPLPAPADGTRAAESKSLSSTGEWATSETAARPSVPAAAPSPVRKPAADASGLRAGYADDNRQFNYFVQFLEKYAGEVAHRTLDVRERIVFRVKDASGLPVANADVEVLGGVFPVYRSRSYADGTVLFFPRMHSLADRYVVSTSAFGETVQTTVERAGRREVEIVLPVQRKVPEPLPLDVVFVLDTTGSMGEEIERLKLTIELIHLNLSSVSTHPLVRFGLVLYKDVGDEYVTRVVQPTEDLAAFQKALGEVYADGGGDTPEDLESALGEAMRTVEWNREGIRLAFVITDAPPHLDYQTPYTYAHAALDAQAAGIKLFSVGTGGLDIDGEYVLRQIAQYSYARYIFLTYGEQGESEGGAPGSVSHHTGANFQTDKLESIIIRFAREELAFQSARPLVEEEEYFEAVRVPDEEREKTLATLFDMAIGQLLDYSSGRIPEATRAAAVPLVASDAALAAQAEYLSEQLVLSLARSSRFRVVERKDLQKILEELELQLSGLADDSQAAKVGGILGAEVLVTGRLFATGDRYEVFLKLLRVETGEVLSATKARVDRKLGI